MEDSVVSFAPRCSVAKRKRSDDEEEESSKKQKISSSSSSSALLNLDNLRDDLLIEVLLRLPTAKSLLASSILVSKRWRSLIHNSYFVSRFISHHINQNKSKKKNYCVNYDSIFISRNQDPRLYFITGGGGEHGDDGGGGGEHGDNGEEEEEVYPIKYGGFKLEFLPDIRENVYIMASCNDLLFCLAMIEDAGIHNYYVCNPFTMQWLLLPPPPRRDFYLGHFTGLVCEPDYQTWVSGQQYVSRFRVVCVNPTESGHLFVDTYCSETGQWNESFLSDREECNKHQCAILCNVVAYNGKLYWYNGTHVVAYDPFNNGQTIFMDGAGFEFRSSDYPLGNTCIVDVRLGVCQGFLRFMRLVTNIINLDTNHLSVWELTDYETRRFSLLHKIFLTSMITKEPSVQNFMYNARAIAFHPNNKDVVYVGLWKNVISCNIHSGELKVTGKTPYEDRHYLAERVFAIGLPWWPTPVLTLPQNAHLQ